MAITGLCAAAATTAQASAMPAAFHPAVTDHCHIASSFCFWSGNASTGEEGHVSGSNGNWSALPGGSSCPDGNWNNCINSGYNQDSQRAVRLWQFSGDTGGEFCVIPSTGYSQFSLHKFSNGAPLNDAVSANFYEAGQNC
jgi:hypothetical protein